MTLARIAIIVGVMGAISSCSNGGPAPGPSDDSFSSSPTKTMAPVRQVNGDTNPFIGKESASLFLSKYNPESPVAQKFFNALQQGDATALTTYSLLRPKADTAWAEALDMAAARALPYNPEGVLSLAGGVNDLSALCTSPFIEPDPAVEKAYLTATAKALKTMTANKPIDILRRACLHNIEELLRLTDG